MKKVMLVFGTRPEAIKMAPLCHLLKSQKEFNTLVCVTAQHRQMLDQALVAFELCPDIDLDLMKDNQDLFDVTSSILLMMRDVLTEHKPDIVLVHGDTTTAFATSLAAFYTGICIGHVEAGLRTNDLRAPFPEEFNRKVAGLVTDLHFAPTDGSKSNLLEEGISAKNIWVTGNTVIDSLHWILRKLEEDHLFKKKVFTRIENLLPFDWLKSKYILITGHRRENFGSGFSNICLAIQELAHKFPDFHFVYPVHLNPKVQIPVLDLLSGYSNIHLISPLDYEPFVCLLKYCHIVLTDSGGIQEEAPSLGKPVLVMRDVTERPEALLSGSVRLVGTSSIGIFEGISQLLENDDLYKTMSDSINPYGDGEACQKIMAIIKDVLK